MEIVYERVAGIDVHKRQITVAVRTPGQRGKRRTEVRRFATFYVRPSLPRTAPAKWWTP